MGLEEVKKEILDTAKRQAQDILKEAKQEAAQIAESTAEREQLLEKKLEAEAEQAVAQYRTQAQAQADSTLRKDRLMLQKQLVEEVFSRAAGSMEQYPASKRKDQMSRLISMANSQGFTRPFCSERDLNLVNGAKPAKISGGLIMENQGGDIRIDMSYESLLDQVKQDNLTKVIQILFENHG